MNATDYDRDFYQWTQQQAALLRQGQLSRLDVENLAEEIESMGKSDRRALGGHLTNVLLHLLKWQYQPRRRSASWALSINNGRQEIGWIIQDSPSLRPRLSALLQDAYPTARRNAAAQTRMALMIFPETCPFSAEQVIDDYWPDDPPSP